MKTHQWYVDEWVVNSSKRVEWEVAALRNKQDILRSYLVPPIQFQPYFTSYAGSDLSPPATLRPHKAVPHVPVQAPKPVKPAPPSKSEWQVVRKAALALVPVFALIVGGTGGLGLVSRLNAALLVTVLMVFMVCASWLSRPPASTKPREIEAPKDPWQRTYYLEHAHSSMDRPLGWHDETDDCVPCAFFRKGQAVPTWVWESMAKETRPKGVVSVRSIRQADAFDAWRP